MQHINSTFTKSQISTEGLSSTIRNMMLKIAKASHKTRTTKPNRASRGEHLSVPFAPSPYMDEPNPSYSPKITK